MEKYNNQRTWLFIVSGRPITSLMAAFFTLLVILIYCKVPIYNAIVWSIPIFLVTMIGFVFNDIYDKNKDKIANKNRPITTGQLSVVDAKKISLLITILMFTVGFFCGNINTLLTLAATYLLVFLYSPVSRKIPLVKTIYTAILCCMPLLYGYYLTLTPLNPIKFLPVIVFIVGREIWLDKIDLTSDLDFNIKTIAFYLGEKKSLLSAFSLMAFGLLMTIYLVANFNISLIIGIVSLITLGTCFIVSRKDEGLSVSLSRIPMIMGIIALLINKRSV